MEVKAWSARQLADFLGKSHTTVSRWLSSKAAAFPMERQRAIELLEGHYSLPTTMTLDQLQETFKLCDTGASVDRYRRAQLCEHAGRLVYEQLISSGFDAVLNIRAIRQEVTVVLPIVEDHQLHLVVEPSARYGIAYIVYSQGTGLMQHRESGGRLTDRAVLHFIHLYKERVDANRRVRRRSKVTKFQRSEENATKRTFKV